MLFPLKKTVISHELESTGIRTVTVTKPVASVITLGKAVTVEFGTPAERMRPLPTEIPLSALAPGIINLRAVS